MIAQHTMAFVWGVCLMTLGWMTYAEASVPENLDKNIDELKAYYIKDDREIHNAHPVFLRVLKDLKESEQNLLMSIIMDTYSRIFTRMQNESLDEATKDRLAHVQEHLKKLQDNYFPGKSAELKTYAETLWAIKENDPVIQRKALFELKRVYREATQMRNLKNKDRRRRQAKSIRRQKS
ncbi:interferon gamma 1 isoform X2 [Pimephales promelas]|uniref:interferon gamma 1 isoform X2 n=1 Tax=Pimephales promelas TaxID=90988 RepID=UPI001955766B|nr:interferon gamma 1 isoform X2 [Pimephales promelas]KAG1953101.1 interferon gamma [Pimephales promelas]